MSYKKIVEQKIKEFQIQEFIKRNLKQVGLSSSKLQMTPLGEKVIVNAARPGLIVGKRGQSIKRLTNQLRKKFNLENPQIEINEVENPNLDAEIIAERIVTSLERFGSARFKAIGHKVLEDVMNAGGLGIEVVVSGKVPSARAKRWRFYQGYLKKSGDVAITGVKTAYSAAQLKSGTIGIQVRIMPPIELPDKITIKKDVEEMKQKTEEKTNVTSAEKNDESEKSDENKEQKKKQRKRSPKKKEVNQEQQTEKKEQEPIKVEEKYQEAEKSLMST